MRTPGELFQFKIMGIVNVTPDSFSDGQKFLNPSDATIHALNLIENGADLIDVGAESSRPGALPIDPETEWARLAPVLIDLNKRNLIHKVTVDTYHPETMLRLLEFDIYGINNICGLAPESTLCQLASSKNLRYIAMHKEGVPFTMQKNPLSGADAVDKVERFFTHSKKMLKKCGFDDDRIFLDPGIGFGKSDFANLALLAQTPYWSTKHQLLLGISRKSFIGRLLQIDNPIDRDQASKGFEISMALMGAKIIRTHIVAPLHRARQLLTPP